MGRNHDNICTGKESRQHNRGVINIFNKKAFRENLPARTSVSNNESWRTPLALSGIFRRSVHVSSEFYKPKIIYLRKLRLGTMDFKFVKYLHMPTSQLHWIHTTLQIQGYVQVIYDTFTFLQVILTLHYTYRHDRYQSLNLMCKR